MVKVFWSELDIRLHELALDLLGPHAELARRRRRGVDEGLRVRARRPDLRGHQRDPTQRDRRARARPPAEVAHAVRLLRRAARVPRRDPRPARERVHARARARRVDERHRPRPRPVGAARRHGHGRDARARSRRAGSGSRFVDLVLVLEETGRFAVPEPIVETAAWGVPLARPHRSSPSPRASTGCRGPTPPT